MLNKRTTFDWRTASGVRGDPRRILCRQVGLLSSPTTTTSPPPATSTAAASTPQLPQPDPSGLAIGDKASASDAGGNSFVVSEPAKDDPQFKQKKADFDAYTAAAAKEPLATKLADSVGHLRIATNTAWTLSTGYLVLFMQAGFALLTCGLVRKKNAGHLMMLNFAAYVFAFLAYYAIGFAFQWGGVAINAAPTQIGGAPHSTSS